MTKRDGGKDHTRFEWAVLARCRSQYCCTKWELQRKGPSPQLQAPLLLTHAESSLASVTSWTNMGLTVIERLDGFNFTISCGISKQKHNSLHRAFLWGSVSIKFWFFFAMKEVGVLSAGYAIWKAASWRPWVLPNPRHCDVLQRSWAGRMRGKREVSEIYLSSKRASQESSWLCKAILTN